MKNWKYINGAEVGNEKIQYSPEKLKSASWTTWKYIIAHPEKYDEKTVEEAKKLDKVGNSCVGNSMGKDIYQHKLDPNQYMVVDWDKDTVTIIVNGAVRDVIKSTDKVAYAVSHVYKKVNSMNKTGNETMHEWATSKPKNVGNTKVINSDREFFKELADDAKEREDNDKQEVEKLVENRLDWSENLVGKEVWVKSGRFEWKCYVMQDKGDKVYIRHDSDGSQGWVSKGRISGKVNNSKVGNAKDKNGKDLRVGDIVLVWTSSGERAGKVKEVSGDRITVAIRNEGDWSTPGKLADKVSNSKAQNGLARARNAMAKNKKVKNSAVREYKHSDGRVAQIDFNEDGSDADMSIYEGTKEIEQRNFSTIRDAEQYVTSHGFRRI